ncbi:MAG TPA: hypothetical protein VLI55_21730 [Bryobacteraceae bacterium]|nr:hypothetical protein [Bryobacteraceae bacterium]
MKAKGGDAREIVAGPSDVFLFVLWSPDGRRLAFQRRRLPEQEINSAHPNRTWRFEAAELVTGRVVANVPSMPIGSAAALLDGRILFVRWDAWCDVGREVWEVKTSLSSGAFLGVAHEVASAADANATLLGLRCHGRREGDDRAQAVGPEYGFCRRFRSITAAHHIRRLTLDERLVIRTPGQPTAGP